MASQQPMGLVGRTGELIHYRMGDKYFTRAAPKKFKQTKATKRRAGEFGQASGLARSIRSILLPVIPQPRDRKMQGKLVAVVFQWLSGKINSVGNSIPYELSQFPFAETQKTVGDRWRIQFKIKRLPTGELEIEVPAFIPKFSINAPTFTVSVTCSLVAGIVDPETGQIHGSFSTKLDYKYDDTEVNRQTIPTGLHAPKSSLVLLGASLDYTILKSGNLKRNTYKAYMPSGIVEALLV
jgi:hypothetical protein